MIAYKLRSFIRTTLTSLSVLVTPVSILATPTMLGFGYWLFSDHMLRSDNDYNGIVRALRGIESKFDGLHTDSAGILGELKALNKSIASTQSTLEKIELGVRSVASRRSVPDELIDILKKEFGDPPAKIDQIVLTQRVRGFLERQFDNVSDTFVQEMTKDLMCDWMKRACPPSVTVNTGPINVSSPPVTVIVDRHETKTPGMISSLRLHMSVWFADIDGVEDGGAIDNVVIPRVTRNVGTRQDCRIFVDGNADTTGGDEYNKALSKRRADRVIQRLAKTFGDMVDRTPVNHGERNLAIPSGDGRPEISNRRADIFVTCG